MNKPRRVALNEVSYLAVCGTEINPGDYVIASVTGTGRGKIHVGIYRGLYPNGRIALDVQGHCNVLSHKETGEAYDFKLENQELPTPSYYLDPKNAATLWEAWRIAFATRRIDYESRKLTRTWRTILNRNLVYSLATIAELKRL